MTRPVTFPARIANLEDRGGANGITGIMFDGDVLLVIVSPTQGGL